MSRVVGDVLNFFSSRRRHTRCALVTGVRRVLFLSLLRSTTTEHPSGLHVVAAPPDIIPLESVSAEQMSDILDLARQEFSNVLVDLPGSWTNWSLSLVALADAVCLITEMSIPSLRQARRQLDMLASQDLGDLPIYVKIGRAHV